MVVEFQSKANAQGELYERVVAMALTMAGIDAQSGREFSDVGIDVDIVGINQHGIAIPVSCAGSWNLNRPGFERTDTFRKKIAEAFLLALSEDAELFTPLLAVTSHLPISGRGYVMLNRMAEQSIFLNIITDKDQVFLRWLASADVNAIQEFLHIGRRIST